MKNVNSMKSEKFNSKSKSNQFVDETFSILKNFVIISMTINNITNFFDITKNDNDFSFKKNSSSKNSFFNKKFFFEKFNFFDA